MDIKQLNYFVAIVEEGNISAAAKKLMISQPPLSHRLKMLEQELGIKLMERGSRRVELTEAGKALYKRAKTILEITNTATKELNDISKGLLGTLSLGTISSSGATLLSKRMTRFHQMYPNVSFDIHESNTYSLIELVKSGIIELAVVRTPFSTKEIAYILLEKEPMAAVGRKQFFDEILGPYITMNELSKKPLIYYRRFENILIPMFQRYGLEPQFFCRNEDARTSLMWAAAGLGVAIIPKTTIDAMRFTDLEYKIIQEEELYTQIGVIWKENSYLSSIAQCFLKVFQS